MTISHSSGEVSKQSDMSLESGKGFIMEIEDWGSSACIGYLKLESGCNHYERNCRWNENRFKNRLLADFEV